MKQYKLFFAIAALFLAVSLSGCGQSPAANSKTSSSLAAATAIPAGHFYFYSAGCAHCETVAAYVKEHDIRSKMYYIDREVSATATANNDLLKAIAKRCLISETQLSVPLFWDGTSCHMGAEEVISYFEQNPK